VPKARDLKLSAVVDFFGGLPRTKQQIDDAYVRTATFLDKRLKPAPRAVVLVPGR
jgi:hypothetical protein